MKITMGMIQLLCFQLLVMVSIKGGILLVHCSNTYSNRHINKDSNGGTTQANDQLDPSMVGCGDIAVLSKATGASHLSSSSSFSSLWQTRVANLRLERYERWIQHKELNNQHPSRNPHHRQLLVSQECVQGTNAITDSKTFRQALENVIDDIRTSEDYCVAKEAAAVVDARESSSTSSPNDIDQPTLEKSNGNEGTTKSLSEQEEEQQLQEQIAISAEEEQQQRNDKPELVIKDDESQQQQQHDAGNKATDKKNVPDGQQHTQCVFDESGLKSGAEYQKACRESGGDLHVSDMVVSCIMQRPGQKDKSFDYQYRNMDFCFDARACSPSDIGQAIQEEANSLLDLLEKSLDLLSSWGQQATASLRAGTNFRVSCQAKVVPKQQKQSQQQHEDGDQGIESDEAQKNEGGDEEEMDNNEEHNGGDEGEQDNNEEHNGGDEEVKDNNEEHNGGDEGEKDNNEEHNGGDEEEKDNEEHNGGDVSPHHKGEDDMDVTSGNSTMDSLLDETTASSSSFTWSGHRPTPDQGFASLVGSSGFLLVLFLWF